jgi:hypothetical protein
VSKNGYSNAWLQLPPSHCGNVIMPTFIVWTLHNALTHPNLQLDILHVLWCHFDDNHFNKWKQKTHSMQCRTLLRTWYYDKIEPGLEKEPLPSIRVPKLACCLENSLWVTLHLYTHVWQPICTLWWEEMDELINLQCRTAF